MKWITWGLGGLALVLASGAIVFGALGAAGGGVSAQAGPGAGPLSRFDEYLAEELGISVDELDAARETARNRMIDDAVTNGRLTPAEAERLKDRDLRGPPYLRHGGKHLGVAIRNVVQAATDLTGLSAEELWSGIRGGESLAEMAEANGVSRDDLKAGIVEAVTTEIQRAVDEGVLSEERAARLSENLDEHVERALDYSGDFPDFSGRFPLNLMPNQN